MYNLLCHVWLSDVSAPGSRFLLNIPTVIVLTVLLPFRVPDKRPGKSICLIIRMADTFYETMQ